MTGKLLVSQSSYWICRCSADPLVGNTNRRYYGQKHNG